MEEKNTTKQLIWKMFKWNKKSDFQILKKKSDTAPGRKDYKKRQSAYGYRFIETETTCCLSWLAIWLRKEKWEQRALIAHSWARYNSNHGAVHLLSNNTFLFPPNPGFLITRIIQWQLLLYIFGNVYVVCLKILFNYR